MNGSRPVATVVVPTHNRSAMVRQALDALGAQTLPADQFEVVVVADGCSDGTLSALRDYHAPFRLHVVEQPNSGAAAARNAGAAQAEGDLLIFLDDDVEAAPSLVEAHVRAHEGQRDGVVIGYMSQVMGGARADFFQAKLRFFWEECFQGMRNPGHRHTYIDLFSGNFSLPTELFRRVGGFETALRCREDFELGLRLIEAGAAFSFSDEAAGKHHGLITFDQSLRRKRQEGRGDIEMGRRHPRRRPALLFKRLAAKPTRRLRILRSIAAVSPAVGDAVARALRGWLDLLEWARWRDEWGRVCMSLNNYWYWRGAMEELRTPQALADFLKSDPAEDGSADLEIDIDLSDGLEAAERRLDAERPAGARIFYKQEFLGRMAPVIGTERLRGLHLGPRVTGELALPLFMALRLDEPGQGSAAVTAHGSDVFEVDLSSRGERLFDIGGGGIYLMVRYAREVVGGKWIDLPVSETKLSASRLRSLAVKRFGWPVARAAVAHRLADAAADVFPPISVVVCTRDRTAQLTKCLKALLALDYPDYEIIVIDNASSDDQTEHLARSLPVRYVREERAGLDWARNRGAAEASNEIIAFTDDDARPDPHWLRAISRAFAETDAMAVTGSVGPFELETEAQRLFELDYGGMSHGFRRRIIRRAQLSPRELLWSCNFGVGANMAFRGKVLRELGGFDPALDAGTPSGGAGDLDLFHRVVAAGHTLVHEPAALVWHQHRREMTALRRQLYNNGRAFGCYLLTCLRRGTLRWTTVAQFLAHWLRRWIFQRLARRNRFPRWLVLVELGGMLLSPFCYVASQWHCRTQRRRADSAVERPMATPPRPAEAIGQPR